MYINVSPLYHVCAILLSLWRSDIYLYVYLCFSFISCISVTFLKIYGIHNTYIVTVMFFRQILALNFDYKSPSIFLKFCIYLRSMNTSPNKYYQSITTKMGSREYLFLGNLAVWHQLISATVTKHDLQILIKIALILTKEKWPRSNKMQIMQWFMLSYFSFFGLVEWGWGCKWENGMWQECLGSTTIIMDNEYQYCPTCC